MRKDLFYNPGSLQPVIESALGVARRHADQMARVRELEAKAAANQEAERETGKPLFKTPSPIPPEMLKEPGPRGDYFRATFHLLYQPVRAPYALIIAPAGIGKTRACAQGLRQLAGRTVYYFVPNHNLARQMVKDLQRAGLSDVHQVFGRSAPGMCELDDIAELSSDIASAGLSVQAVLCGELLWLVMI